MPDVKIALLELFSIRQLTQHPKGAQGQKQVHEGRSCMLIKQVAIRPRDGSFITQTIKSFLTLCTKEAMLYREDPDILIELTRVVEYIVSPIYPSFISRSYTSEHEVLCTYRVLQLMQSLVLKMYTPPPFYQYTRTVLLVIAFTPYTVLVLWTLSTYNLF